MQNSSTKKEKIKKSLRVLSLTAQVHGIPRIFNNERTIFKIFWIFSFIISCFCCLVVLARALQSYLSYPFVTNIDLKAENPVTFPTITLCPHKNPLKDYSLNDIIISCNFNQLQDCSKEPYSTKFNHSKLLKTCYQFNAGYNNSESLSSVRAGFYNGLIIKFFNGLFEEKRFDFFNFTFTNGIQVFIHNKTEDISMDGGINVHPGMATYISLQKVVDEKLSEPYNDCIKDASTYHSFDSIMYKEIVSNSTYKQKDCLDYFFLKSKNCSRNSIQNCLTNFRTIQDFEKEFITFYQEKKFKNYLPQCPLECDSVSFTTTISQSEYPSYEEYLILKNNQRLISKFPNGNMTSIEDLKKSVYLIYIYFSDLKYVKISQQPKSDVWDLVSGIGGIFGLFLGLSFLSLVDIVQIILEMLFILFEKNSTIKIDSKPLYL